MATLKQKISEDQKGAMKAGDATRLSTLRLLGAAISNKEIELRKKDIGLSDEEILDVIGSEAKKRKDAILEYTNANRIETADKESAELAILQSYLPPEMSDEDLRRIIQGGIRETGATSEKEFGKVMKSIMPLLKGKASGDRISKFLKEELSSQHS
jgi:uncharacterized protein